MRERERSEKEKEKSNIIAKDAIDDMVTVTSSTQHKIHNLRAKYMACEIYYEDVKIFAQTHMERLRYG